MGGDDVAWMDFVMRMREERRRKEERVRWEVINRELEAAGKQAW